MDIIIKNTLVEIRFFIRIVKCYYGSCDKFALLLLAKSQILILNWYSRYFLSLSII